MALLATNGYQALAMDLPGTDAALHLNPAPNCVGLSVLFVVYIFLNHMRNLTFTQKSIFYNKGISHNC